MTKKDKQEVVELFNQGMTEIILPVLDEMNKKMSTKDDIQELREDLSDVKKQLDTIDRRGEAQQNRLDRQGRDIESLKKISAFA